MKGFYIKGKAIQIPDPEQVTTVDGMAIARMSALLMPYSSQKTLNLKKPTDSEMVDFLEGRASEEVCRKVAAWLNRNPDDMCAFMSASELMIDDEDQKKINNIS